MKPRLVALALLALAGPLAAEEDGFTAAMEAGHAAVAAQDLPAAIHHYREATAIRGEDPRAHWRLGRVLAWSDRWDEAEAALRRALELDPGFHDARLALGHLERWRGDPTAAAGHFRAILADQGDYHAARVALGDLAWATGDRPAARDHYREALARNPEHRGALIGLARVETARREPRVAARLLTRAWDPVTDPDAPHRLLFDLRPWSATGLRVDGFAALEREEDVDSDETAVELRSWGWSWRATQPLNGAWRVGLGSDHRWLEEHNEVIDEHSYTSLDERGVVSVDYRGDIAWTVTGSLAWARLRSWDDGLFAVEDDDGLEPALGFRYAEGRHAAGLAWYHDSLHEKRFARARIERLERRNLVADYAWRREDSWRIGVDGALRWLEDDNRERALHLWVAHPVPGLRDHADLSYHLHLRGFERDELGYYSFDHQQLHRVELHLHREWHQRSLLEARFGLRYQATEDRTGGSQIPGSTAEGERETTDRVGWDAMVRWRRIWHTRHRWAIEGRYYGDTEGYLAASFHLAGTWHF